MKNFILCNNCQTENPLYSLTCSKCNGFIRSKIPNIDFWDISLKMIDTPIKASESIIQADHKNLVIVLMILVGFKLSINIWTFCNAVLFNLQSSSNLLMLIITGIIFFAISILVLAVIKKSIASLLQIQTRILDYLAITIYSFLPILISLFVLTPIQIALYGFYFFTFNPSPFIIKPLATYVLVTIEALMLGWSLFLLIVTNYSQLKNKFIALILGVSDLVIIILLTFIGIYLASFI